MPMLYPPEYPECPDAPLLGFGLSFSEEMARSVTDAVWRRSDEDAQEAEVRIAAALTMFEAFHPRDQLECMYAAQGVAAHAAIMDCFARAMNGGFPEPIAAKLRSNACQVHRMFSTIVRDLERRQSKPLPPRPAPACPDAPPAGPAPHRPDGTGAAAPPEAEAAARAKVQRIDDVLARLDAMPERPEDIETRPDGTPGSFAAYAAKPPPPEDYVPEVPAIVLALATRPKPWRQINVAPDPTGAKAPTAREPAAGEPTAGEPADPAVPAEIARPLMPKFAAPRRGPLAVTERTLSGDALSRFVSARLDPDAPVEPVRFDDDNAVVELELISTGGDPEAEARMRELRSAHPEGKAVVTLRYGSGHAAADASEELRIEEGRGSDSGG